jgi:hypothetical protein
VSRVRSNRAIEAVLIVLLVVGFIWLFSVITANETKPTSTAKDQGAIAVADLPTFWRGDDLTRLIEAIGKPELDDNTAYDNPQPFIVTRWLKYDRAGIEVVANQKGLPGSPPPYEWEIFGYTDMNTNTAISETEACERLWRNRPAAP